MLNKMGMYRWYHDIDSLSNALDFYPKEPKFIFVHLLQAHDAIYNEKGEDIGCISPVFPDPFVERRYSSSVEVTNVLLLRAIKAILEKDSEAVIVVQADHGIFYTEDIDDKNASRYCYYSASNRSVRYRFGIFSAVYLPKSIQTSNAFDLHSYFSGGFALVNVFRVILAAMCESSPILLLDRPQFLYWDEKRGLYRWIDPVPD
jgi:hypothetical protein